MKEKYFSPDTIDSQAINFLSPVIDFRNKHDWDINNNQTALLVLDMQKYFLNENSHAFIPSAPAIIPNIINLRKALHSVDMPVIFTQHINDPSNAGQMSLWWKEIMKKGNPNIEIIDQLLPDSNEVVITKTQYDSFYKTDLEKILR